MSELIKDTILSMMTSAVQEEGGQWPTFKVSPEEWSKNAALFKEDPRLRFDYLFCLTCVDWKMHFTVVYHLYSNHTKETVVIKTELTDRANPFVRTVSDIWRTAEFHEREAYDLFGVKFSQHPDLRRLFLTDDWKGFPLRKDYEDPINMIKL